MSLRFGKLTLIEELKERRRGAVVGLWKCDCGNDKRAPIAMVRFGSIRSCGCLRTKHGHGRTSGGRKVSDEYRAWMAMNARCNATKGLDPESYRKRGITVCARWADFRNFLADMGERPSKKHSLDRIDNDKGYSPDNCRWGTPQQQLRNTRQSRIWHIKGKTFQSVREAASHFRVDNKTVRYWVKTKKEGCRAVSRY